MRRVELWADEPDRPHLRLSPKVISLEVIKRQRHDDQVANALDEGTAIGFGLGLLAALLVWAILSGALMTLMVGLVLVIVRLLHPGGWA
jgi:hypothetical protein